MTPALSFGCHLPIYGPAATRDALLGFARRMEALGYDSLWVSDHVAIPWTIRSRYPYNPTGEFPLAPTGNFLEPLTALALVAGATERIALGTSVLVVPHRHPVLTAKMLATLDHTAPGRVILGAGVGWMKEEIELFGVPYERRGAWTDEALRIMRACWRDERVSFSGEFFRFDDLSCLPGPARGTIPIWIGGHSRRAMRRVAELGDGWHAAFANRAALETGLAELQRACAATKRDASALTVSVRIGLSARRSAFDLVEDIKTLRDAGASHVILESRMRDAGEMITIYERFAADVRGRL